MEDVRFSLFRINLKISNAKRIVGQIFTWFSFLSDETHCIRYCAFPTTLTERD